MAGAHENLIVALSDAVRIMDFAQWREQFHPAIGALVLLLAIVSCTCMIVTAAVELWRNHKKAEASKDGGRMPQFCLNKAVEPPSRVVTPTESQDHNNGVPWDLPHNILVAILSMLPSKAANRCACVATTWRCAACHPSLAARTHFEASERVVIKAEEPNRRIMCSAKHNGLVALGGKGYVKIFRLASESWVASQTGETTFTAVCFARGMLLGGDHQGRVVGWDTITGDQAAAFQAHKFCIKAITEVGNRVATAGLDWYIKLWGADWSCEISIPTRINHTYAVLSSCQGEGLYYGGTSRNIFFSGNPFSGHSTKRYSMPWAWVRCLQSWFDVLVCGGNDGRVCAFDVSAGEGGGKGGVLWCTPPAGCGFVTAIDLDGSVVVVGYSGSKVMCYDQHTGEALDTLDLEAGVVQVTIDSGTVVAVAKNGAVVRWACRSLYRLDVEY